jgi:soluble lytic murein transglycosylase-like protein
MPETARPATVIQVLPQKEAIRHQALAEFLAKRYRVSRDSLERFIRLAYAAGHSTQLDPLLILAVMAVESSFNPIAESVMGAKGLMQIIPEYHQDKLRSPHGGEVNVLDPEINIVAGAKVLREYATRTDDDLAAALRLYGGVGTDLQNPYPNRVLSERQRLEQIVRQVHDRRAVHGPRPSGSV